MPVLVGRQKFSDELLRRVGRGTDLWFQVREGRGSRVLLRTSLCRELTRAPRECVEVAADLAVPQHGGEELGHLAEEVGPETPSSTGLFRFWRPQSREGFRAGFYSCR